MPPSRCGWHLSTSGGNSLTNQKPWDLKRKDKGKHANETSSNVRISLIEPVDWQNIEPVDWQNSVIDLMLSKLRSIDELYEIHLRLTLIFQTSQFENPWICCIEKGRRPASPANN